MKNEKETPLSKQIYKSINEQRAFDDFMNAIASFIEKYGKVVLDELKDVA